LGKATERHPPPWPDFFKSRCGKVNLL